MSHLDWGDTSEITRGVRVVEEFENIVVKRNILLFSAPPLKEWSDRMDSRNCFYIVVTH